MGLRSIKASVYDITGLGCGDTDGDSHYCKQGFLVADVVVAYLSNGLYREIRWDYRANYGIGKRALWSRWSRLGCDETKRGVWVRCHSYER